MTNQKISIDLSRFVALGDSITAGYADGALYYEAQQNTYPNLIAQQYKLIQPIEFTQPLVSPDSVGIGFLGRSRLILKRDVVSSNTPTFRLSYMANQGDQSVFSSNIYHNSGPFNNMAIPGAKLLHLLFSGYGNPQLGEGNYNSFFTRMASNIENTSVLSDALQQDPTFFALYIGNNDVLGYAMRGGTMDSITPLHGKPGEGFESTLEFIIDQLMQNGAQGILATIPNITTIPFFNTIPYNSLVLSKAEADALNITYSKEFIHFNEGSNPYVIEEIVDGKTALRHISKHELILSEIILDPSKKRYLKGLAPVPKHYTLTADQVTDVQTTILHYNEIIQRLAKEKQLALVNLNKLLKNNRPDRYYDSSTLQIVYEQNGVFSLDGMHINALGQAVLANEFIKAIHKTYKFKIPRLPIFKFRKKQNMNQIVKPV